MRKQTIFTEKRSYIMKFYDYINMLAMAELNASMPAQVFRIRAAQEKQNKR